MSQKTDERITQDVFDELAWDPAVTLANLSVSTNHGRVRLNGTADTFGTKLEAAMILGVRGLVDEITVNQPQASAVEITSGIARAFALNAELYDDNIDVTIDGGHV